MQLTVSTLFSRIGTQMFAILVVLFALSTYHSPAFSGVVILCSQLPGIVVSPVAGALLDRGAKVPLMALDYGIEAVAIGAIGMLAITHELSRPLLIVIALVGSFTQPLSRVGARTLYPLIVPAPLWDRTNALDGGSQLVAMVLGPVAAGLTTSIVGARVGMLIVAATFAVAALSLAGVRMPPTERTSTTSLLVDSRDAVVYVFRNKVLRMLASSVTLYSLSMNALLLAIPVLVLGRIHGSSTAIGLIIAVFGVSGFVAGFVAGRVGTAGRERGVMFWTCLLCAGSCAAMEAAHGYVLLVAMMAIAGGTNGPLTVAMFSLRQRATDPDWYGRAFAVSMNLNYGLSPAGTAVIGVILSHSISGAFLFMASFAALAALWPALAPASSYVPATLHAGAASSVPRSELS